MFKLVMNTVSAIFLFGSSLPSQAGPLALTDATFFTAIKDCLVEDAVGGLCINYGNSSGYGTMPEWDTSEVTVMTKAFVQKTKFNGDISRWNTSKVTKMDSMFRNNRSFNQDISGWDTRNVTTMATMFTGSYMFSQDIRLWDVSKVTSFDNMFFNAISMYTYYCAQPTPTSAWFSTGPGPAAPFNLVATLGEEEVSIAFNLPAYYSYCDIDYEYQLDGGDWYSAATPISPVVITGLTNGTTYSIKLRSVTNLGEGTATVATVITTLTADGTAPNVTLSGPTGIVTDAFTVTATFSENVVGFELGDITVVNGTASALVANDAPEYTFTVTPELGTTVSVTIDAGVADDAAGNTNEASNKLTIQAGSPESYFAEHKAEVQAIITQDATRSLNSTLSSNQRMTRGARSRFIDSRSQGAGDGAGLATRNNVPFDVDGTFDLAGARLSTKGTFFGQTGNMEGTERRLVFGEFDVQRDGDTGSTTATLTGRVAWEQMISDDTMLGYFVGGELADSNISGAFEGKQTRVAATAGGYAVRALSETLFADGFISIGAGRNNLEMADDVLALTSDYTTRTATVGGALTGVYAYERYELRPEMAFSYGKTWIGDVGFTGVAYGLTDNTLSVDAGTVSTASLTLRPEIVWALDAETVADSNAQLSFAPRFICERTTTATTTQNCGAGAEIGLSSNSEDGLSSANIRFVMDRVGNSNRSNVVFNVEHRF